MRFYTFCVIEVASADRHLAVALVAQLLKAGFALQNSSYPTDKTAFYTLIRQPNREDRLIYDSALIDQQIAEAQKSATESLVVSIA